MRSRGMPARSSRLRTGGRTSRLGAGRVMSHTEIAALPRPLASSSKAAEPIGESSPASTAPMASASGRADRASKTRYRNPDGRSAMRPVLPKAKSTRIAKTYHNQGGQRMLPLSEGKLHQVAAGGWSGYVGSHNSRGDGHSLLVLINAVFASDSGPLRHLCGQVDTVWQTHTPSCPAGMFPGSSSLR